MYITTSFKSYRQILLTVGQVVCVVALVVAPIALIQAVTARRYERNVHHQRPNEDRQPLIDQSTYLPGGGGGGGEFPTDFGPIAADNGGGGGQLGEIFDVNQRHDAGRRSAGKSILRLKRQSGEDDAETGRPSLAQLTAAGTAAGMMIGDQIAAAHLAAAAAAGANGSPQADGDRDDPDESDGDVDGELADGRRPQGVDLAALQSLNQAPPGQPGAVGGGGGGGAIASDSQQAEPPLDPERMPDSMESLMGAEQDELTEADEGDASGQQSEQPAASSQVAGTDQPQQQQQQQQSPSPIGGAEQTNGDDDGDNDDDDQRSLILEGNFPGSYLPAGLGQSNIVPGSIQAAPPIAGNGLGAQIIDSSDDLSAAAGHHYKKKKKKKIVIKKKKKKVKKYKVKKIKVIKYKKKKMVKKKKKPMKMHHHDHGKYYMYAKVPKKKSWEFGFKKGNKKHWIERHEKGHKSKFKTKVKWFDKKSKGKGVHIWDYNHHDKKKKKHY